jgi:hypothetical protein
LQVATFLETLDASEVSAFHALVVAGKIPAKFASFPTETKVMDSLFTKIAAFPDLVAA